MKYSWYCCRSAVQACQGQDMRLEIIFTVTIIMLSPGVRLSTPRFYS